MPVIPLGSTETATVKFVDAKGGNATVLGPIFWTSSSDSIVSCENSSSEKPEMKLKGVGIGTAHVEAKAAVGDAKHNTAVIASVDVGVTSIPSGGAQPAPATYTGTITLSEPTKK